MLKKTLFTAAAFMLAIVAASGVGALSYSWIYEPDAPACLKKEL